MLHSKTQFKAGDFVTRDGTDIHEVVSIDSQDPGFGCFRCVKEPKSGWIKIGEIEQNLTERYSLIKNKEQ